MMLTGAQFEARFTPRAGEFAEQILEVCRMAWNTALEERHRAKRTDRPACPLIYHTEDQQRVLNLMPNEYDCDPEDRSTWGPTDGQIAEQLGMTLGEVKEHLGALDNQGWCVTRPR